MASRPFNQFHYALEKNVVHLYLKATFASGVATIVEGKGIKTFAKTGTGAYRITLGGGAQTVDKYQSLLSAQATFKCASGLPAAPNMAVVADTSATTGIIDILFAEDDGSPAAKDPADADTLLLKLELSNSTSL